MGGFGKAQKIKAAKTERSAAEGKKTGGNVGEFRSENA
jgi:hypothetical protein